MLYIRPDHISNRTLKCLAEELCGPLCKLFNKSLFQSQFPDIWKCSSVVPIHKKNSVHDYTNYRPVSLTSCLSKVFEKCVFKHVSNFFLDNENITPLQSGFTSGDSTSYQLTHLYDYIARAMDCGKEVRAVFCDISKAFDRVWHKGLLHKLWVNGIRGSLLSWFDSYLNNRKQFTVINGYKSNIKSIEAGVPQGSVLGPLLFLVYINDIVEDIQCNIKLFADDTSLYVIIDDPFLSTNMLNDDLDLITKWAETWKVDFNPKKTESVIFSRKRNLVFMPDLIMNGVPINSVSSHKHLGLTLQSDGFWNIHIDDVISKVSPMINCLRNLKYRLQRKTLHTLYSSFILPIYDYCDYIWNNSTKTQELLLEKLHLDALRTKCGSVRGVSHSKIYLETGFTSLSERRKTHQMCVFHKMFYNKTPSYLSDLIPVNISSTSTYESRSSNLLQVPKCRTEIYKNSFIPSSVIEWNKLDDDIRNEASLALFKKHFDRAVKCNVHHVFENTGTRLNQIIHCRLRLGCSDLNAHKFDRFLQNESSCSCGHHYEDTLHFLFICPNFNQIRSNCFFYTNGFDLHITVLFGNYSYSDDLNENIVKSVHEYFTLSRRFLYSN